MNNDIKENFEQMETDRFFDEVSDREMLLELFTYSTLLLPYLTEEMQKSVDVYRRGVKIKGMMIALDVFDVCEREKK